ncbi:uncharacterized protein LOC141685908 [Apium graveolens]|uniref:uncharacterized protein LOC141685908 n=1 Tax=Apium graveolens TaxID=4045 RepID=UPI003D78C439
MKGGLGFRDLYGFNIALLGKHCWNFINNPQSLVSRVYKERYFSNTTMLGAKKGQNPSFIWQGIMTAKTELQKGFRWIMGDGESINATKDPWLRLKADFCVENSHIYSGRDELVTAYIKQDTREWNIPLITEKFVSEDVQAILSVPIPQRRTRDRLVWSHSTTGAKEGYRFWQKQANVGINVLQSHGWQRIWKLLIPHKIKIFIWRFCRNILPVRWKLRSRGVQLPITCPMCMDDIEHLSHVFFDCHFAMQCWNYVGLVYDMQEVEDVTIWLLGKLSTSRDEKLRKICTTLWGIWFWRNKKVWED